MILLNYFNYALTLRSPISPISIELVTPINLQRAMSGAAYSYIKRPLKYRLTFTIQFLTSQERDDFISFYHLTHPNIFSLTDNDDQLWFMQFLDPKVDIEEISTKGNIWQTTLRLEGTKNA